MLKTKIDKNKGKDDLEFIYKIIIIIIVFIIFIFTLYIIMINIQTIEISRILSCPWYYAILSLSV